MAELQEQAVRSGRVIPYAGSKRSRSEERNGPHKSPRLSIKLDDSSNRSAEATKAPACAATTIGDANTKADLKTSGNHDTSVDPTATGDFSTFVDSSTSGEPLASGGIALDLSSPIGYWAFHGRWPENFSEQLSSVAKSKEMEGIQAIRARKRNVSSRSDPVSSEANTMSGSQSLTQPREMKSAEYRYPEYRRILATKAVFMNPSIEGASSASKEWCTKLLKGDDPVVPKDNLFSDELFAATCVRLEGKNESRVVRDIALLLVPSAENLAAQGAAGLSGLVESVNEGWKNCIPITKTRPQPDFSVGFGWDAFSPDQIKRMLPITGHVYDHSYFLATYYMYFPFLMSEVKSSSASLDVADRQNAHSAGIAVRAVVELFKAMKREKELHREILAFSVSHDSRNARIYGYYAEIDDGSTRVYRHMIDEFCFASPGMRDRWTCYRFTKNVYEQWAPMHFKRLCSAIDQIPHDISFSPSQGPSAASLPRSSPSQPTTGSSLADEQESVSDRGRLTPDTSTGTNKNVRRS